MRWPPCDRVIVAPRCAGRRRIGCQRCTPHPLRPNNLRSRPFSVRSAGGYPSPWRRSGDHAPIFVARALHRSLRGAVRWFRRPVSVSARFTAPARAVRRGDRRPDGARDCRPAGRRPARRPSRRPISGMALDPVRLRVRRRLGDHALLAHRRLLGTARGRPRAGRGARAAGAALGCNGGLRFIRTWQRVQLWLGARRRVRSLHRGRDRGRTRRRPLGHRRDDLVQCASPRRGCGRGPTAARHRRPQASSTTAVEWQAQQRHRISAVDPRVPPPPAGRCADPREPRAARHFRGDRLAGRQYRERHREPALVGNR